MMHMVLTASLRARFLPICPVRHGPDDRLPPARRPGVRADQRAGSLRAVVRPGPNLLKTGPSREPPWPVARGLTSESDSGCEWPTAAQKLMASAVPRPTAHPQAAQPNHMWSKAGLCSTLQISTFDALGNPLKTSKQQRAQARGNSGSVPTVQQTERSDMCHPDHT
jgi:hypothetical protein